ncbi:hypothetical protein [Flavobacterium sasangense]|uniref:hypothetical protein n=1 Tax=Flavobacterium sasangense TaxID=503361 RepID=UPI00047D407F|nr:hypothetical protein [Flavobacterium sasangense]
MKNNKRLVYIIIGLCAMWILYNFYYGHIYNKELKKFEITTVGKITKFKGAAKSPYLNFIFFIDGKFHSSDSHRDNNGEKIGEFFKVVYSSKNLEVSRIYLDEKITDTTLILKAGFSKEDIENMPK